MQYAYGFGYIQYACINISVSICRHALYSDYTHVRIRVTLQSSALLLEKGTIINETNGETDNCTPHVRHTIIVHYNSHDNIVHVVVGRLITGKYLNYLYSTRQ